MPPGVAYGSELRRASHARSTHPEAKYGKPHSPRGADRTGERTPGRAARPSQSMSAALQQTQIGAACGMRDSDDEGSLATY